MGSWKKIWLASGFLLGLILLLLWLQGFFSARLGPGLTPPAAAVPTAGQPYVVSRQRVVDWQEAPGVVNSRNQPQVAAQITGRVLAVKVQAGDRVQAGQLLALLDDQEVRARVGQAEENLAAVLAQYQQAVKDLHRFQNLVARKVVPAREYDQVKARHDTLQAQVQQARQAVAEAKTYLAYTRVTAPISGLVAEKLVDPGDLATPGRPLFTLFDPAGLQLWAQIAEQYRPVLQVGAPVLLEVPALQLVHHTAIAEVVAQASVHSRTFLVKAPLLPQKELRPGMFGRFYFDRRFREILVIPRQALHLIGQLEMVQVVTPAGLQFRQVRTGKTYDHLVEILAGLEAGEQIWLPDSRDDLAPKG